MDLTFGVKLRCKTLVLRKDKVTHCITEIVDRPVESHSGVRETIIVGPPITTSFRMRRDRDAEGVEKEETWGRVSPHHSTMGLGERRKLPAENGFHAGQNEAIWNTLSLFLSNGGTTQTSQAGA